jgi:hypothetical protein
VRSAFLRFVFTPSAFVPPHEQVARNTPAAEPPWAVRRLLRGRRIEYIETKRR